MQYTAKSLEIPVFNAYIEWLYNRATMPEHVEWKRTGSEPGREFYDFLQANYGCIADASTGSIAFETPAKETLFLLKYS